MSMQTWREIPTPARKAEYAGKHLLLLACPYDFARERHKGWARMYKGVPDLTDTVVYLLRRISAKETQGTSRDVSHWGAIRVLCVSWECSLCGSSHECCMPESWIEEGKAVFVERVTSTDEEN